MPTRAYRRMPSHRQLAAAAPIQFHHQQRASSSDDMATETDKEEQARRAQALAEKCFLAGNLFGARQWMQSAARLAPDLPGTAQIAAAYDVHAAAARRPPDWYAVLGLPPPGSSGSPLTHDDVKRQHRRLCLHVHPDKNPCAAADGAFKLVQAAWQALSARHPPGGAAAVAAAAANKPWPPPPAPNQTQTAQRQAAQPQPRPRPQVVQMPRRADPAAAAPTYTAPGPSRAQSAPTAAAKRPQKKGGWVRVSTPSAPQRPTSPVADKCPSCGARTNGKKTFRCMSCQWSPMDERQGHDDDYDDDYFDYDY